MAGEKFLLELKRLMSGEPANEFISLVARAVESAAAGKSTREFAAAMNLSDGVSGYVYHSVPVALHGWLANRRDLRAAVLDVVRCGGDTDTTAAIVGGIIGAGVGKAGIPRDWLDALCEWPRTVHWMERLGDQLAAVLKSKTPQRPLRLPVYGVLPRNLLFLMIVLTHGFRRILPPY